MICVAPILGIAAGSLVVALLMTQIFGYQVLVVQSDSMKPALVRGDLIVTRPADINLVEPGDIILFESGQNTRVPVVHRIDGTMNVQFNITDSVTGLVTTEHTRSLRTKGDANPRPDGEMVDASRLKGVLWFSLPGIGGWFSNGLLQQGLLSIAVVSVLTWIGYEAWRFSQRSAKSKTGVVDESSS